MDTAHVGQAIPVLPRVGFTRTMVRAVEERYGRLCWICERPLALADRISIDHVQPRVFGGADGLENYRPAHRKCNTWRGEWCLATLYAYAVVYDRLEFVPQRLLADLRARMDWCRELAEAAPLYYNRASRWHLVRPLTGSWHEVPPILSSAPGN